MTKYRPCQMQNILILVARVLLVWLFVIFGWPKLSNFAGTVAYMGHVGAPVPMLAAIIAVAMEFFGGIAILLGVLTRPLALLYFVYTLSTALIGHHYWTMTGPARMMAEIGFYKNISIMGGFLLLYVTGAGAYSLDGLRAHQSA